ncbi:MAG: hypothetical protein ACT4OI_10885 [Methanobacteriota archaeon]
MLQQALEQMIRDRGWSVASEGRVITAVRDGDELVVAFLRHGDAKDYVERVADSSAILAAVLLEKTPAAEVVLLEEAGVTCFAREEVEDVVVMALMDKAGAGSAPFLQLLERGEALGRSR